MEDVQQGAAVIAAPLLAERFGAAGDDVGDGATMRWQSRVSLRKLLDKVMSGF